MNRTTAGDHSDPSADLHRTREWLNYIFNATPVGMGLVLDQVIREVNPHLCQMLGYDADELLGQPVSKIFPGHEQADAISGHGMGNLETRLVRKDGKILDILLNSVPLDQANLSAGMTFTAMDITGQKWTEKALIDREQRSRNLIDTSPMGIFIYRVDEAGELILIEANPATESIRHTDRDIPIIALTAFAFVDDRERAIQAGCTEHLSKPVRIEELKGVVRRYLG